MVTYNTWYDTLEPDARIWRKTLKTHTKCWWWNLLHNKHFKYWDEIIKLSQILAIRRGDGGGGADFDISYDKPSSPTKDEQDGSNVN